MVRHGLALVLLCMVATGARADECMRLVGPHRHCVYAWRPHPAPPIHSRPGYDWRGADNGGGPLDADHWLSQNWDSR
jgi:hypothetical protein